MILAWTAGAYFGSGIVLAMITGILFAIMGVIFDKLHYDIHSYLPAHHPSFVILFRVIFRAICVLIAVATFILALRGRLPGTKIREESRHQTSALGQMPPQSTGDQAPESHTVFRPGMELMKRAMFTILWAVVFFFAAMVVGSICLPILCKIEGWNFPFVPMGVGMVWALIATGSPLVALSLGSRGILPGTKKKSKDKAEPSAQ